MYIFGGTTFSLGLILFGIATARAGMLPRGGAWLLIIGAPIFGIQLFGPLRAVGVILYALGLARPGWALWSDIEESLRAAAGRLVKQQRVI